ncbi:MAG: hypothetical protein HY901_16910 [Deltaproteobacteria bacterium]|nr:hypothetical protein [Deltaproteobacteria bacterium]
MSMRQVCIEPSLSQSLPRSGLRCGETLWILGLAAAIYLGVLAFLAFSSRAPAHPEKGQAWALVVPLAPEPTMKLAAPAPIPEERSSPAAGVARSAERSRQQPRAAKTQRSPADAFQGRE